MHLSRLAVLSVAFGALAFSAQAVSVSLIDSSVQAMGNDAHLYAPGFAGNTPAGAIFSSDPLVTPSPGNLDGIYQSPFNNTPLLETQTYFSVGAVDADGDGAPSPVTLTFAAPVTVFDILWGSIDDYNTITFFSGMTELMSFTGSQIVAQFGLGGSPANFERVALLRFAEFGDGGLTSVQFRSDGAAFEFALAPVPLPASALLLLGALGGLGVISRQRKLAA